MPAFGSNLALDVDQHLTVTEVQSPTNSLRRFSLKLADPENYVVAMRIGQHGPILGTATVKGFNFWDAYSTYARVVQTYPDGSDLVEVLLILSPVLPNVTARLDIFASGVMFEDGTISLSLTAPDFDALGQRTVRFIRPASVRTAACYTVVLIQGDQQIGYY